MSTQTIWALLKGKGFSDKAAAVIMGQMDAESSCVANRLQGDFGAGFTRSAEYTAKVDAGQISRYDFAHNGPGGGGYGLCQWTYWSRKEGLYDKAKSMGQSIGSEDVQIAWLWDELHQGEYRTVLNSLITGTDILEMTTIMVKRFERPADQSTAACSRRALLAEKYYSQYAGTAVVTVPTAPDPCQDTPTTPFWPPRMLTKGMIGSDVGALQALLVARGYEPGTIDGILGDKTEAAMWTFQLAAGMSSNGDFGPKSWALLLKNT